MRLNPASFDKATQMLATTRTQPLLSPLSTPEQSVPRHHPTPKLPRLTDIDDIDAVGALGVLERAEGDSERDGQHYETGHEEDRAAPPCVRAHRGDLSAARTARQLPAQGIKLRQRGGGEGLQDDRDTGAGETRQKPQKLRRKHQDEDRHAMLIKSVTITKTCTFLPAEWRIGMQQWITSDKKAVYPNC